MSGDSQKILELASECERTSAPDRSLDGLIAHAIGATMPDDPAGWPPRFTASLDAALTLVPSGAGLTLNRYWIARGEAWSCLLCTGGVPSNPRREFTSEDAASGPAALTAAALRARAAI